MSTTDVYDSLLGAFYRHYIAHPRLGRLLGRLLWDSDFAPMYAQLEHLAVVTAGTVVVDSACGAGLALQWLDPATPVTYIGVDASPAMLARARHVASRVPHADVQLHLGDVGHLPVDDASADVALTCNALHCLPDPVAALDELARVCRAGGRLLGSMLVRGGSARADWVMANEDARPAGTMGPGGTAEDLTGWLTGWDDLRMECRGAMAVFTASKPG